MSAYILHAVIGGAAVGIAVGFAIQPLRRALQRRRARKAAQEAHALPPDARPTLPEGPYVVHRKWRIAKHLDAGYYHHNRE